MPMYVNEVRHPEAAGRWLALTTLIGLFAVSALPVAGQSFTETSGSPPEGALTASEAIPQQRATSPVSSPGADHAAQAELVHAPTMATASSAATGGPIPIPDEYATFEGATLEIAAPGLIANDYHPEGIGFILSNFFSPEHGSLTSIVTNGAFRYVPPPGFTGTDTFRYILRDANGVFSEPVVVTIQVFPDPNRPPIPVPDEYATLQNALLDVPAPGLIRNDIDPDGDSFILSNFFSPEHGTLQSIVTNGAFRYAPPASFTGTDTFRYLLRDSRNALSDPTTVTIHVVPPGGDHPVGIPDHYVITAGMTLDVPAPGLIANDIDPSGDSIILSNFFSPDHGSLTSIVTNGAFRYVPPPSFVGTDSFRYIIRNSKGNFSEPVTVTVQVLPDFNRPPIGVSDFFGTPMNATLEIAAPGLIKNDFDPDSDSFILSNFFSPQFGTLSSIVTNGAFRYVPPADFEGIDSFRYILRDEHGTFSEPVTVTIFVGVDPAVLALDTTPPECHASLENGTFVGLATDLRSLDPDNTGIFFVQLADGSTNLSLDVDAFTPGDESAAFRVTRQNPDAPGDGAVVATDGAGNTCRVEVFIPTDGVECRPPVFEQTVDRANRRILLAITDPEGVVLVNFTDDQDNPVLENLTASSDAMTSLDGIRFLPAVQGEPPTLANFVLQATADQVRYFARIENACGAETLIDPPFDFSTGTEATTPLAFSVEQNYPNPFRSATSIAFALAEPEVVRITVFDLTGREVIVVSDVHMLAGSHTVSWDGHDAGGQRVASGTYLYRIQAGDFIETRRMTFINQ
jgi:hypothetical protein